MDLISVIVPAYNAEKTLRRACVSVLSQSGVQVELVAVNDGSRDATAAMLDALAREDDRVVVIHQENGGVSKARNEGLDAASGAYIMFLDSDDELLPGALETMLGLLRKHDCHVAAAACEGVRPDGTSFSRNIHIDSDTVIWRGQEAFRKSLEDHPATYAVWGKLYRREAVDRVRFVEGKKLHEDSFFLFELLQQNVTMVVTRKPILRYYLTAGSASRSMFTEKFLDMLYFGQRKYEIIESRYPELVPLGKNVLIKANMALLKNMWKPGAEKFRDVEAECQKTIRKNAAYYVAATGTDRILLTSVRLHLFWLYKLAYRLLKAR